MRKIGYSHIRILLCALSVFFSLSAAAYNWLSYDNVTIGTVLVNGGTDSINSGTTCIQTSPEATACSGGFIYIPNNNKQLLAAALLANSTKAKVYLQYVSDGASGHCPGAAITNCALSSLGVK
jgi:hypothetical protein